MTYTSLVSGPHSGPQNLEGSPLPGSAESAGRETGGSETTGEGRDCSVEGETSLWLLPGRLYPAESWVGIGYIGDGPE